MTAQPLHTLTGVGFEVYDAPYAPDYDWPALEYPAPLTTPQIVRKPRKQRAPIRVVGVDGVVHPADDDTLADVLAAVIPCRALDPEPQPLVFTTPVLPLDEKPALKSLPSKLFATGMSRDKRGWHVPIFGDPRMWELILPKLQELDAYAGHVAVSLRWDVYLNMCNGSFTYAAEQVRGLVYSFDPFKDVVFDYEGGADDSTERMKTDSDGLKYKE